jgi:hypothetical protein
MKNEILMAIGAYPQSNTYMMRSDILEGFSNLTGNDLIVGFYGHSIFDSLERKDWKYLPSDFVAALDARYEERASDMLQIALDKYVCLFFLIQSRLEERR